MYKQAMDVYPCTLFAWFLVHNLISINICNASPYVLIKQTASWTVARSICRDIIGTDLASIHNEAEQQEGKALCKTTGSSCWIGGNDADSQGIWTWSDGTSFDYGQNTSGGVYPWSSWSTVSNANNNCLQLWSFVNYQWDDEECSVPLGSFVCNAPSNMDRYILMKKSLNWTDSRSFCRDKIGTDLASIHSGDDYFQSLHLLGFDTSWIGLNDLDEEGTFVWTDGSSLDFAADLSGGVYPWGIDANTDDEPNNYQGNENCVEVRPWIDDLHHTWNDQSCDDKSFFVCNAPSELCIPFQWSYSGDLQWNDCEIHSEQESQSVIIDKHWNFEGEIWRIDYLSTVHQINGSYGKSGIVIYPPSTSLPSTAHNATYYFAGICINEQNETRIFIDKHDKNTSVNMFNSSSLVFLYEFDRYYQTRLELVYSTSNASITWNFSIFTAAQTYSNEYEDTTYGSFSDLSTSRYVGLKNTDSNITAKSLFVSDSPSLKFTPQLLEHIGCYADKQSERALNDLSPGGGYTISQCFFACIDYQYFALQSSSECYCENDFSEATQRGTSTACSGGTGGASANDVYRNNVYIPPPGNNAVSSNNDTTPRVTADPNSTETPLISPTQIQPQSDAINDNQNILTRQWWLLLILAIAALIIIVLIFVATMVILKNRRMYKSVSNTADEDEIDSPRSPRRQTKPIENALCVILTVGEYREEQQLETAEGVQVSEALDSFPVDIDDRHLRQVFDVLLNYKVLPTQPRSHWTEQELLAFLRHEVVTELFDEHDEVKYDALIVCISGHGEKDYVITSDYQAMEKLAFHRMFSDPYPKLREIPRIFLFDCCGGPATKDIAAAAERSKHTHLQQIASPNPWREDEHNPDYQLAVIHAANPGFQAKYNEETGSYLFYEFHKRMTHNQTDGKMEALGRMFDKIHNELHSQGKQLTVNNFTANTRYLKLLINPKVDL